jgi:regulatory protein
MASPAFSAALRLLARRDYFRQELAARLRSKDYPSADIESTLERCAELGYLDDDRLTERFIELRAIPRGWGPLRLIAELERRGVTRELAEAAVARRAELFSKALQVALQRREQRARGRWWQLHEQLARMVSWLVRRGFDVDEAYQAVSDLAALREREHHAYDDQPGDPRRIP